jgi:hypothetical protein
MLTREQEHQVDAEHLAQDMALQGADASAIREALRDRQLGDFLNDAAISHILGEYDVVEEIEVQVGKKSRHYFFRSCGVAVMLAGCTVWYIFGFDIIPLAGIVFGALLAMAPEMAFFDIF